MITNLIELRVRIKREADTSSFDWNSEFSDGLLDGLVWYLKTRF